MLPFSSCSARTLVEILENVVEVRRRVARAVPTTEPCGWRHAMQAAREGGIQVPSVRAVCLPASARPRFQDAVAHQSTAGGRRDKSRLIT